MRTGELTRLGQLRVIGDALAVQTIAIPRLLRGITAPSSPRFSGTRPAPPDSGLCRDALQEAEETLTPAVLAHSLRCWEFGNALAMVDGRSFDPENLYVAALLHDIRLGAPVDDRIGCFAVLGAEHAREFVTAHGGSAESGHCVYTAIARHMDVNSTQHFSTTSNCVFHEAVSLPNSRRQCASRRNYGRARQQRRCGSPG
jgi:hypothetical protein